MRGKLQYIIPLFIFFLMLNLDVTAQCSMCKAVAESGGEKQAEGLNNGIIFLMVIPYLLLGALAFIVKKQHN